MSEDKFAGKLLQAMGVFAAEEGELAFRVIRPIVECLEKLNETVTLEDAQRLQAFVRRHEAVIRAEIQSWRDAAKAKDAEAKTL